MVVQYPEAVQWLPGCSTTNTESRSGRIGPISLEAKQTGERSARNPHAAFDEAGAGNVAWPRWGDTRNRKSEPTGNTNFGLNRRARPRPYLCGGRSAMSVPTAICNSRAATVVATARGLSDGGPSYRAREGRRQIQCRRPRRLRPRFAHPAFETVE